MSNRAYLILLILIAGSEFSITTIAEPVVTNHKQYNRLSEDRFDSVNVVKKYNTNDDEYDIIDDRSYVKDGTQISILPIVISGSSSQTLYRYIGKISKKNKQGNRSEPKRYWSKEEDWRSNHRAMTVGNKNMEMPGRTGDYFFGEEEVACANAQKVELEKFLASPTGTQLKIKPGLKEAAVVLNIVAEPEKKSSPSRLTEAESLRNWQSARYKDGKLSVLPVFQNVQKTNLVGNFKYIESNCFVNPAEDIKKMVDGVLDKKQKDIIAKEAAPEISKTAPTLNSSVSSK